MVENVKVIAYYTDDDIYAEHAELLKQSLEQHGIAYDIEKIQPSNWLSATAFKPSFIKKKLKQHNDALLYVDIDAIVHADFNDFFQSINADIAIYRTPEGELLSGVIYLQATPQVAALIDQWIAGMESHPTLWDQQVLQQLLGDKADITVYPLPVEYVFIFDTFKERYPLAQPIIEHLQASREMKFREKSNSLKYRILRLIGIRPKVGRLLKSRRARMSELLSQ